MEALFFATAVPLPSTSLTMEPRCTMSVSTSPVSALPPLSRRHATTPPSSAAMTTNVTMRRTSFFLFFFRFFGAGLASLKFGAGASGAACFSGSSTSAMSGFLSALCSVIAEYSTRLP